MTEKRLPQQGTPVDVLAPIGIGMSRRVFVVGAAAVTGIVAAGYTPAISKADRPPGQQEAEQILTAVQPAYVMAASPKELVAGLQRALSWAGPEALTYLEEAMKILMAYRDGILATDDAPEAIGRLNRSLQRTISLDDELAPLLDMPTPDPDLAASRVSHAPVDPVSTRQEAASRILVLLSKLIGAAARGGADVGEIELRLGATA